MALVVEDGSNVPNANSYITRAELITYAIARGIVIADEDATDVFAIGAMDWLATQCMKGEPTNSDQALPWPRLYEDQNGDEVFPSDAIPAGIKTAQLQLAVLASQGTELITNASSGQNIKKEKVGPLETEFFESEAFTPTFPAVEASIDAFTCGQIGLGGITRTLRI